MYLLFLLAIIFCYIFNFIILIVYSPYIYYNKYNGKSYDEIHLLLKNKLFGIKAFSTLITIICPYSSSIYPIVEEFNKVKIKCYIDDKLYLKNPFNSIHAIAIANLGELTSGLLMMNYLNLNNKKGIITKITIKYHKKARGRITAICDIMSLNNGTIKCNLYNSNGDLIAEFISLWNIKNI